MKPEQSHLSEELEQFQREIEYLSKVDFSKGTAARKRVQRRLEQSWSRLPWWKAAWHGFSDFQTRMAVASTALIIFSLLNLEGLFALPQHSSHSQPVPLNHVQMLRITDSKTVGTIVPNRLFTTETPQVRPASTALSPTPMPVPAPELRFQSS